MMNENSLEERGRSFVFRRVTAGSMAMALAAFQVVPAFATIDNTVTASGTGPGSVPVTATGSKSVSVVTAAPGVSIVKTIAFAPGGDLNSNGKADASDTLAYTFTVTNTGNVTLKNVKVADANDGAGAAIVVVVPNTVTTDNGTAAAGTIGDSTNASSTQWDTLGPGDVITFKATYVVVQADINAAGGGSGTGASGNPEPDGFLDDKATVTADFISAAPTVTVTANDKKSFPLNVAPNLTIVKTASPTTPMAAGNVVTYTYTVSNTGNAAITNITLADTHNGVAGQLVPAFSAWTTNVGGLSTHTGNTINVLQPGDVATFTATYTVVQFDVDTRQ